MIGKHYDLTLKGFGDRMAIDESVTKTPTLQYEASTGFIVLTDGECRQVVARPDGMRLYLYWKRGRKEIPVSIDHLMALIVQAAE